VRGFSKRCATLVWLFALFLSLSHFPFLRLPYFWDEAGQFIPAALDLFHSGFWIPHSVPPNIHPPAIAAYLAVWWRVVGFSPATTRTAMLLLATFEGLAAYLLSLTLCDRLPGRPAFLAVALLMVSPIFFAQSMLAQLDGPALLFTCLSLLLFLQDRPVAAAGASIALVLVKETGVVVPLVFAIWLVCERRWRQAAWFAGPVLILCLWVVFLSRKTGYWAGNAGFVQYNLDYPLHPARFAASLLRRLYYLFVANFHWIGTAAIIYGWRKGLFTSRSWCVAWTLAFAHVVLVTGLGGAVLDRYLLPILPFVYAAMAAGLSLCPPLCRRVCSVALLACLATGNWINPPYPFPYEDNLAFTDFLKLHKEAAAYLARRYPGARIGTVWPLTAELSQPELDFTNRPMAVRSLPDLAAPTLQTLDWDSIQVLVAFSRDWDPPSNPFHSATIAGFWQKIYSEERSPNVRREMIPALVPFFIAGRFERHGQWVDIYVNPHMMNDHGY